MVPNSDLPPQSTGRKDYLCKEGELARYVGHHPASPSTPPNPQHDPTTTRRHPTTRPPCQTHHSTNPAPPHPPLRHLTNPSNPTPPHATPPTPPIPRHPHHLSYYKMDAGQRGSYRQPLRTSALVWRHCPYGLHQLIEQGPSEPRMVRSVGFRCIPLRWVGFRCVPLRCVRFRLRLRLPYP